METDSFPGRLGLLQRVLPRYRAPFFDALAAVCAGGLSVFAGAPRPDESIAVADRLEVARLTPARNLHLLSGALYLCYQRGLLAWLKAWNPDALIVEANPRYLSTPAALHWMKRRGRPVLGWGLGAPPVTHFAALRTARRMAFLRRFDALLTYSRRGAEEYAALGFPADRIFVAPNAAAPRPAWPQPSRPAKFDGRPQVLFVGRLQARKRIDLLLRACASLAENLQPALVIVGDGPARPWLEKLAAQIYPRAEFAGAKHGNDLLPYFLAADLFVLPGTGGLAVQQAMAYGLPVIMGAGDGTNEDLVRPPAGTSPGNGWQVPPDNLAALTEALRLAISDPSRLRAMGAESYRIVREEINLERMVAVFMAALQSVA